MPRSDRPGLSPFQLLLPVIAGLFVLMPFFYGHPYVVHATRLAVEVLIIISMLHLGPSRRLIAFVVGVAVANELTTWLYLIDNDPMLVALSEITSLIFIATTFVFIVRTAWTDDNVDANLFAAAIAAYFMLGYFWGNAFSLLEFLAPGSFNGACAAQAHHATCDPSTAAFPRLNYLSFVTMTTLGYGDVLPLTRPAEGLTTMSSVTGQLYLAVLIGRIIGLYVARGRTPG